MELTQEQRQSLKDLTISPGWEMLKLLINEQIRLKYEALSLQQFQDLLQVGNLQGQIIAYKDVIKKVDKYLEVQ